MNDLYQQDLAFIQAAGFADFARRAAPEILRLLRYARKGVRQVLDIGCGAGPLSAALADAGFEVTGVDVSEELLSIARRACPSARFIRGSIYDLQIPVCEAILAVGEPLTYHEGDGAEERVRRFFQGASETLPPGGLLIFDMIELGEPPLSGRFWTSGDDWAVLVSTTEDQSSRMLVRDIETFRKIGDLYRRGHEVHRVWLFLCSGDLRMVGLGGVQRHNGSSVRRFSLAPATEGVLLYAAIGASFRSTKIKIRRLENQNPHSKRRKMRDV